MPPKANFIFEVRTRISEAFTLDSIVRSPRTFKPKDVHSACQNTELVVTHGEPSSEVVNLATYVMTDFFAMAHATGLYNRQKTLWESLSKVNSVQVKQLSSGVFNKQPLSIFDFSFLDYKNKTLLLASLVGKVPAQSNALGQLKSFVSRASGKCGAGVLVFFPAPIPLEVIEFVQKQTHTEDPVGRYESIMPGINRPFDLLEMNDSNLLAGSEAAANCDSEYRTVFQLMHPDLKKKSLGFVGLPANAKLPNRDRHMEESAESPEQPNSL